MQALKAIINNDYNEYVKAKEEQHAINHVSDDDRASDLDTREEKKELMSTRRSNEFEIEIEDSKKNRMEELEDDPYFSQVPGQ